MKDRAERKGPVMLTLGATGHRDLLPADVPQIRVALHQIFAELKARYPHTPLRLLSPLAEGADRVAAEAALEAGAQLIVPLPMPRGEYEKDFATAESKEDFHTLLGRASHIFELPLVRGATAESIQGYTSDRDRQYEQVGAFVARNCQILLALWDGEDSRLVGGTAAVVNFKLNGLPPEHTPLWSPLDEPQTGPVYHLPVRRLRPSKTEPAPDPARVSEETARSRAKSGPEAVGAGLYYALHPQGHGAAEYDARYRQIDEFNRAALSCPHQAVDRSKMELLPEGAPTPSAPEAQILEAYGAADILAIRFQKAYRRRMASIYLAAAVMVGAFDLEHYLRPSWPPALVYVLAFASLSVLYLLLKHKPHHERHLECRALAEGLRVQLFWRLAGLHECVADHYLRKQVGAIQWVREALRSLEVVPPAPAAEHPDLVAKHWVGPQAAYFETSSRNHSAKVRTAGKISFRLFGFALLAALGWFVAKIPAVTSNVPALADPVLGTLSPLLAASAALLGRWAEQMTFEETAKEYHRMARLFSYGLRGLGDTASRAAFSEEQRRIILDLGREALRENADWVLLRRQHPARIPK